MRAAIHDHGPAVLLLPRNVQSDACADELLPLPTAARRGAPGAPVPPLLARRLNTAIDGPVAPLVIAGRGALAAEARSELLRLADAWGAAIAVAPDAKSTVASAHPRLLGVAGVMGHPEVLDYAARAPVCVLAGTRLPDVSAYGLTSALAQATLVSLNERPCFPGLAGHRDVHELPGPLAQNLAALRRATAAAAAAAAAKALQPPYVRPPAGAATVNGARLPLRAGASGDEGAISAERAMLVLGDHLEYGSDVLIDAGNAGAFAIHHLPSDGEGMRSVALGMGAMGHAFGAAIGACEFTHRRTYVVAGDGAFYMHGMEIHTAIERRLPITFVIINNNAHAMCNLREQRLLGGATDLNLFAPARLGDGVRAMFPALEAAEVGSARELERALSRERACEGPYLISVTTAADEQPPFWPLADRPMTDTQRRQEIAA
jgi:acetolactate synthase-1/2/3 large subunit